jgi:CAAX prenyl protease-like protein
LTSHRRATLAYAAPFIAYVSLMAIERAASLPAQFAYPVRLVVVTAVLLLFSRPYLSLHPSRPAASVALGVAVFLIWIAPDLLFGYRHFRLFENPITGTARTSIPAALQHNPAFLAVRMAGSFMLVPIVEELFWRGWMMRWLIDPEFERVKFGTYAPLAFWAVAALFASEHGPYWEVGLAAGVLYNWWAVRTRNLADCILAHAVTNAILSAYVLVVGQWQYWL